jgi:hypothetical protein
MGSVVPRRIRRRSGANFKASQFNSNQQPKERTGIHKPLPVAYEGIVKNGSPIAKGVTDA